VIRARFSTLEGFDADDELYRLNNWPEFSDRGADRNGDRGLREARRYAPEQAQCRSTTNKKAWLCSHLCHTKNLEYSDPNFLHKARMHILVVG
jgi:hypothetical protein